MLTICRLPDYRRLQIQVVGVDKSQPKLLVDRKDLLVQSPRLNTLHGLFV